MVTFECNGENFRFIAINTIKSPKERMLNSVNVSVARFTIAEIRNVVNNFIGYTNPSLSS